jgi:hypothetical protein
MFFFTSQHFIMEFRTKLSLSTISRDIFAKRTFITITTLPWTGLQRWLSLLLPPPLQLSGHRRQRRRLPAVK